MEKKFTPEQIAMAMVKHMESVFPPTTQVREIIARVRKGGDETMLELDISKMLIEYFGEAVKIRDSMPEEVKKTLDK